MKSNTNSPSQVLTPDCQNKYRHKWGSEKIGLIVMMRSTAVFLQPRCA